MLPATVKESLRKLFKKYTEERQSLLEEHEREFFSEHPLSPEGREYFIFTLMDEDPPIKGTYVNDVLLDYIKELLPLINQGQEGKVRARLRELNDEEMNAVHDLILRFREACREV
jgi:hypothetical protein